MRRTVEAKPIKSAQRVLEVLEYFGEDRPEASVTDISRAFGYPQSSASELLNYLVYLGYLRRGSRNRTFRLSMRVSMLGAWVQPQLVRSGKLLRLMDDIADATDSSVTLASNNGVRVQCLHAVRRTADAPRQGDSLPLLHSAEGRALLLTCERELVRKYVHRINAETEDAAERVRFEDLAADLDESSARGYVRRIDPNGSAFAILMPNTDRSEQLALCVRARPGASEESIVRIIRSIVSTTLGLVSIPSPMPPHMTTPRRIARAAR
jgi:DNA-binding IclR family transcriptional regulator